MTFAASVPSTIPLGDISMCYRKAGDGPLVALVHGLAEDHRSWASQQASLTGYRTLACDLRGHGRTTLGRPAGNLAQLGGDPVALLEEFGPAACVGFSLGGTIVLWVASVRPDLVRDAVVLGTSSIVGPRAADFYRKRIELVRSGDRAAIGRALREDTAAAVVRSDVDIQPVVESRLEAIGDGGGYCNAAAAMVGLLDEPLTPLLRLIRCRVLVVGGEHDVFCPSRAAEVMLEALPESTYVELPRSGHLMNVDSPAGVTRAIREFLETGRG